MYANGMGFIIAQVRISHPQDGKKVLKMDLLVDTGALYSVIPERSLKSIGIEAKKRQVFTLANGTQLTRHIGVAWFSLKGRETGAPVIFGQRGDKPLLGVTALEALGFEIDPIHRRLKRSKLFLL